MHAVVTKQAIEPKVRDLLLCALSVTSGAVDAICFFGLGKVFAAAMTGNIALLGLQVAGAHAAGTVAILSSMIAFVVGVYLASLITKPTEGSGVWPQRVTVALGAGLIAHTAFLVIWLATDGQPSIDIAHVLLGLWGFAMGMQSGAVRSLRMEGVFTTAATATIIWLMTDLTKCSAPVPDRWRFAGVLVSMFVGATAAGLLLVHAHAHIYAPFLPFVISTAVVATAAILFRRPRNGH